MDKRNVKRIWNNCWPMFFLWYLHHVGVCYAHVFERVCAHCWSEQNESIAVDDHVLGKVNRRYIDNIVLVHMHIRSIPSTVHFLIYLLFYRQPMHNNNNFVKCKNGILCFHCLRLFVVSNWILLGNASLHIIRHHHRRHHHHIKKSFTEFFYSFTSKHIDARIRANERWTILSQD